MKFSDYTESCLRRAGWFPGRHTNTEIWRQALEREGYELSPKVEEFLAEFGGLRIRFLDHRGTANEHEEDIQVDPSSAVKEICEERLRNYIKRVNGQLIPIGFAFSGYMVLCATKNVRIFAGYDPILVDCGSGEAEVFNNLCETRETPPVPEL